MDKADEQAFRLVELDKLREEITERINHQIQILSLMLTGVVGLLGVTFTTQEYILVLIIPTLAGAVGLLYVAWQFGIARIGEYIYTVEPEDGWEHFLQVRLTEAGFSQGNFYTVAVSILLLLPTIAAWLLFAGFAATGKLPLPTLGWIGVGAYGAVSLVLTIMVVIGLRATLWEFGGIGRWRRSARTSSTA